MTKIFTLFLRSLFKTLQGSFKIGSSKAVHELEDVPQTCPYLPEKLSLLKILEKSSVVIRKAFLYSLYSGYSC